MILDIRIENCFAFSSRIDFSLEADMRSKKLSSNVNRFDKFNVLKTAGIYGPNNVGKSCFVKAIKVIRDVMLNKPINIQNNLFMNNSICSLGISFLYNNKKYSYDFKYDVKTNEYLYEKFCEIKKDNFGNESTTNLFCIDRDKEEYFCEDKQVESMLSLIAKNNILIYLVDVQKFPLLNEYKDIFVDFASCIDIVPMSNIPIKKTIDLLKNKRNLQNKVVDFIKNADLDLENFYYADDKQINLVAESHENGKADEDVLNLPENIMDQIRLTSIYKGIPVPSMIFDSTGTKKIAALSSYIVEALEYGRILIVDELDSGLHFKLTRAIVAMFNNELNNKAQMIFTVHDINLMDCKKLLRKEQVWFLDKDEDGVFMYSLSDFTAQDGVRDTTNVIDRYKKGLLGALPDPTFINTLFQINLKEKE